MAAILAAIASAIITFLVFLTINFVRGNQEGQCAADDEVVTETGPQKRLPWKRSQYDYQGKAESVEAFMERGTFDELFKFLLALSRVKRKACKNNWAATQHLRTLSLKAGLSLKFGDPANYRSITIGYIEKFLKFDPETSTYSNKGMKKAPPPPVFESAEIEIRRRKRKPGSGIKINGVPYHETEEYKAEQNPQPAPPPMRDILSSADTSHWEQQPPPFDNRPPLFQYNDDIPRFHNQPNEPISFEYVGKTQNKTNYPFGPPLPPMTSIV